MISTIILFAESENIMSGCAKVEGAMIEYSVRDGRCIADRVLSTDPLRYLDSRFYPGTDITEFVK